MSKHLKFFVYAAALFAFLNPVEAVAQKTKKGKLVQRYASLRANDVNVRAGPGVRYHVKWKFIF